MAIQAKHPHIRLDEKIWDDPVILKLSPEAFRTYIFAIAWSKSQGGRTPDGLLTQHGIQRIGAVPEVLTILESSGLLESCISGYTILKYSEWQKTSSEEQEEVARIEEKREVGRRSVALRRDRRPAVADEGFDAVKAFEEAWDTWPDAVEPKFTENRDEAFDAFCANITNAQDFNAFSAAVMKRIKDYHTESKPKAERRRFLGYFKNFCADKWRNWIPKSYRAVNDPTPLLQEGIAKLKDDPVTQKAMASVNDNTAPPGKPWMPDDIADFVNNT
jgi:hypothetical protein